MKIHLDNIPDEGLTIQGQLPEEILRSDKQNEEFTGPIEYDLHAYLTEDEDVIVTGSLAVPIRMTCARCSERFDATHQVDDVQIVLERPSTEEVELDEPIREELLIALPSYPHCDEEGNRECPGWAMIAEINLKNQPGEGDEGDKGESGSSDNRWGPLDDLKL